MFRIRSFPIRSLPVLSLLGALVLGACDENPTSPGACDTNATIAGSNEITVSGTLKNKTSQSLPSGTRVLVAWGVSSGSPDYSYVFGEGTVCASDNAITLALDGPPPPQALNSYGLGVGTVFLTTNTSLKQGSDVQDVAESDILGAAGQYAIIYLDRDPAEVGASRGWAATFKKGYNVGKGIDLPGTFDGFEPAQSSAIEIIVDRLRNIDFVNWT